MMNNNTFEVNQELKELAPTLANLPKNIKPSIPEGYFQLLENQVMSQIYISKNTETDKFHVPDAYFENFESNIEKMIYDKQAKTSSSVKIVLLSNLKWIRNVAAVLVLIAAVGMIFNEKYAENTSINITSDNSNGYLEYIEDNIDEYDINTLIDYGLIEESDITLITYANDSYLPEDQDLFIETSIEF